MTSLTNDSFYYFVQDPDNKHHVIKMTEHFYFRDHLCIAMELLSMNLYELIKANQFAGFSTVLIRRFTVQMLSSLVLMRHHRVVHCDLKPEVRVFAVQPQSGFSLIRIPTECITAPSCEEWTEGNRFWK